MVKTIIFSIFIGTLIGAVVVLDIAAIVIAGRADKSTLERPDFIKVEE